ncbi:MAG: hypothetical protein RI953_2095, partial [Pseudomonadota bacterium]
GDITTLGRGGSDTTAVALAASLHAKQVEFFKDVEGIFDKDPKTDASAKKHDQLTFAEAHRITLAGAQVLQSRCIAIARDNLIPLWVLPFQSKLSDPTAPAGTWIGVEECSSRNPNSRAVFEK